VTPRRAAGIALASLCLGYAVVHGLDAGMLFLAPALLLSLPLLAGRYVGAERLVARLPRVRALRVPLALRPSPRPLRATIGELIARSLEVRPPPRLLTT
jgi:hypothetical protein